MSGKRSRGKASSQTNRTKLQPEETRSDPATPASNHAGNGQANTAAAYDPFDTASKRRPLNFKEADDVERVLTDLPVEKPDREAWFRVHPEYVKDAYVIELKSEGGRFYLLSDEVAQDLCDRGEATLQRRLFYLAITRKARLFLWGVRVPLDEDKPPLSWMKPPLEAARLAKTAWVRMAWSEGQKKQVVDVSKVADVPRWPDRSFRDLVALAFEGFYIDTPDHPKLKEVRGEE
jgi:hypothetical protein